MEIRQLKTRDIMPLSRILSKLDLAGLAEMARSGVTELSVLAVIDLVVHRIPELEDDLFPFLGDLTGMTAEEFGNQDIDVLSDVIGQLARRPEVARFFGSMRQVTA